MKAEYIDHLGDDLRVVNAARVSFDKESEWEWEVDYDVPATGLEVKRLSDKDIKLINYLAKHNHFSPFTHVIIQMRETIPIFVARQRFKHFVGFNTSGDNDHEGLGTSYNEVSRRYVDDTPEFFMPNEWRVAPENAKQGSGGKHPNSQRWDKQVQQHHNNCEALYTSMINDGVAPEQARIVLPQSMYTSYYATGSLAAWARAYNLRNDSHAQQEIRDLAKQWNDVISNIKELEYSWKALTNVNM